MNQRIVLFDLDGTVLDTYAAIYESMDYATQLVMGQKYSEEYLLCRVGQPLLDQMDLFTEDPEKQQEIMRVYRAHNEDNLNGKISAFPGMEDALRILVETGHKVGLVTSKRESIALDSLQYFGLDGYFSCLIGAESSTKHKPEPEPLFVAAEKLEVSINECLYVGDSPYDLQAAKAAGIPSVGVDWGKFFSRETLLKENPTIVVSSPKELLEFVESL